MSQRLKLLIVGYDISLEGGGIQNTSYLLAEYLGRVMDVTVICTKKSTLPNNVEAQRSVYTFDSAGKYIFDTIRLVLTLQKKNTFDYVLAMTCGVADGPWLNMKLNHVPYGVLIHGSELAEKISKSILKNAFYKRGRKYIKDATHVFANTTFTKGVAERFDDKNNIHVILPPFKSPQHALAANAEKAPLLLSIGRSDERKGFQNVLKALSKIRKSIPNIKYVLAGNGPYMHQYKQIVSEYHLEDIVTLPGRVSEEEKAKLLQECGLFLMPSFIPQGTFNVEGFGVVYLEANSYGKFVIGGRSGGTSEAIKEGVTGFLVNGEDIEDIEKAVLRFYDDSFSYSPQECIDWASEFNIDIVGKHYADHILSLFSNKK